MESSEHSDNGSYSDVNSLKGFVISDDDAGALADEEVDDGPLSNRPGELVSGTSHDEFEIPFGSI